MRYKAYGHNKNDVSATTTYFNGTYGCWGALHKVNGNGGKSEFVITNIDYCPPNSENNRAYVLGYRPRQILSENELTSNDAIDRATLLIEAIVGKNLSFEFEVNRSQNQIWVKFSNFQHLPRNHVMWYMFALRNIFEGGGPLVIKEMKKRGIKSLRKLVMAALMISYYKDSMDQARDWIQLSGLGGWNFLAKYTGANDLRSFYRKAKLNGPGDTSFAEGNGYDCKSHGCGIQLANCSTVERVTHLSMGQGFRSWDKDVFESGLFTGQYIKTRATCERAFDLLSDYLKSLK